MYPVRLICTICMGVGEKCGGMQGVETAWYGGVLKKARAFSEFAFFK
jgi:hypothetical protein